MTAPPTTDAPPDLPPPTQPPPPPADSRQWTGELVRLLARLEALREGCQGRRLGADGDWLLAQAEAMVQATEELARRSTFRSNLADAQTAALARAGAFFTAAAGLKKAPARGLLAGVLSAFAPGDALPAAAVKDCLLAAGEALNRYFALFTERFPSSSSARRWVDAASAFLADFKQTIGDLKE